MNYRDKWVENEDGEEFIFTVEMQRNLSASGLPVEPANLDQLGAPPPRVAPPPRDVAPAGGGQSRAPGGETRPRAAAEAEPDYSKPATIQIDPETGKYIGRMKWYNVKKGYGFIVRGGGEEIFFHKTGAVGDPQELQEGQWILYDVEETHKGPEATDVEPYEGDVDLLA